MSSFMPGEKVRVSARIPEDLYEKCLQLYDNITIAINAGLDRLVNQDEDECLTSEDKRRQDEDSIRELIAHLEEKELLVIVLKEELLKAGKREEDLRTMHTNYMLQVQSLINQKAIDGPGQKKWWKFWK